MTQDSDIKQVFIHRVEVWLMVTLPEEIVEQNVGYLPWLLGENLAGKVDAYVMEHGLGYYPAMDFFRDHPKTVDASLLNLIDEVARFSVDYSRRVINKRLRDSFSNIAIDQCQCTAYNLPKVLPSKEKAPLKLSEHYAPSSVKLELILSSIHSKPLDDIEHLVLRKLSERVRDAFSRFDILGTRLVDRTLVVG